LTTSSAPALLAEMSLMHTSYPSRARRRAMALPLEGLALVVKRVVMGYLHSACGACYDCCSRLVC
jgi:hypothetical protein